MEKLYEEKFKHICEHMNGYCLYSSVCPYVKKGKVIWCKYFEKR